MSTRDVEQFIPNIIYDSHTKIQYRKGSFLGKGSFAKCYEIINTVTNKSYAGKSLSKKLMNTQYQREKVIQEIRIHQTLNHKNIVFFHSFFEDNLNVYIVLELCRKVSMMELNKRRKAITEPETRYYMKQILSGVHYLHQNRIIHRDLKLANLLLNDKLVVKIGDFGLATRIEYDGERKRTQCGTLNYMAPEILNKKGYSFEVDIWSIGCIMYTLLIGNPPFKATNLMEIHSRINKCEYRITTNVSDAAQHMIALMLQVDPAKRPKIEQLLTADFIVNGYCPANLPLSCLTMAPRYDNIKTSYRRPLLQMNQAIYPRRDKYDSIATGLNSAPTQSTICHFDAKGNFITLQGMLLKVLQSKPARNHKFLDEMSDPSAQPMIWVSKWVDYSDKYGFGYQLSDEGVGVIFNDTTKLIMLPNGINVHYVDKNSDEYYMTVDDYPKKYDKKMTLLSYFSRYMQENLLKTGASVVKEVDSMSRTPHLHQWYTLTFRGVLMQLNNGTVQMNFSDHTKIIMCPLMAAITYIDEDQSFRTFRFSSIERNGCSVGLYEKMRYAFDKITVVLQLQNAYNK